MDNIRINVAGAQKVGLRFEEFPDEIYDALRMEIESLTQELFSLVQAATPSKTGKLRSQERVRIFADKDRIKGYINIQGERGDLIKGAALEYGAHKTVHVSGYTRADGAIIEAYSRPNDVMERAFERGPLAEMQSQITSRLNAVVEQVVKKANQ